MKPYCSLCRSDLGFSLSKIYRSKDYSTWSRYASAVHLSADNPVAKSYRLHPAGPVAKPVAFVVIPESDGGIIYRKGT